MTYTVQMVTAFLGSMGFSILFNIRRTKLLIAGFGGALSWGVYLLFGAVLDDGFTVRMALGNGQKMEMSESFSLI